MKKTFIRTTALAIFFFTITSVSGQYAVCGGETVMISASSLGFTLSPPANSYTLNPGGNQNSIGNFVFSPMATGTYTLIGSSGSASQAIPVTVTVHPQPFATVTHTQFSCTSFTNAFNINLTFNPSAPSSYAVSWVNSNAPSGWISGNLSASGMIGAGGYTAVIVATGGCSVIVPISLLPQPAPATVSLLPAGPVYSLTCNQSSTQIAAGNATLSYMWQSPATGPQTSSQVTVTFSNASTWTLTSQHPTSGCTNTQTFAVTVNTVAPSAAVTPTFQSITCASPVPMNVTVTAISPTVNFVHQFISSVTGQTLSSTNQTAIWQPGPGVHTVVMTNGSSGCKSVKTITIQTPVGMPVFTLLATPVGYSVGCLGSCVTVSITNAQTMPMAGGAVSYTLLSPSSATTIASGPLSNISTYSICTPGTYMAIVKDNAPGSNCINRQPFVVLSNTVTPVFTISASSVNACKNNTVSIAASSGNSYTYQFSGGIQNGQPFPVTATNVYTVEATDPSNGCRSTQEVTINALPSPTVVLQATSQFVCAGDSIKITPTGADSYTLSPAIIPGGWFKPSVTALYSATGSYSAGCSGTASPIMVTVNPVPAFDYTINGLYVTFKSRLACSALKWDFGNGDVLTGNAAPYYTYNTFGNMVVCLKCEETQPGCLACLEISVPSIGSGGVGIVSHQKNSVIITYPNPVHERLVLELAFAAEVSVYDLLGALQFRQRTAPGINSIDCESLAPGVYVLYAKAGDSVSVTRIVKE
jgi:hypothetical protein